MLAGSLSLYFALSIEKKNKSKIIHLNNSVFSNVSGLFLPDCDDYLSNHNETFPPLFSFPYVCISLSALRDLPLVIVVFSLNFHAFIFPVLSAPVFFFSPPAH